jgi:hypothetical protein
VATPGELAIETGDLVLWNSQGKSALPYVVVGEKEFFTSQRLLNECGFSHAFSAAGEYHWSDAWGSGAAGVVRVKDPGCRDRGDFQRWHKALAQGTLVMISDSRPDPREVEILTGQTVYFAVTTGPGISVTDSRLVPGREVPFVRPEPSATRPKKK